MPLLLLLPLFLLLSLLLPAQEFSSLNKQITSRWPASKWEDAMVSGNGLSGVMQYGGQPEETLIFNNHQFLRPGNGGDPIPDMSDMLAPMREKMLAGDLSGGWLLWYEKWQERTRNPLFWTQQYHPGYQLKLDFVGGNYPTSYHRQTQLDTGEIIIRFTDGFGQWERRTFVSRADDVIVTRLSQASSGLTVNVNLTLEPCEKHPSEISFERSSSDGFLLWRAKYPERQGRQGGYEGVTRIVLPKGGRQKQNQGRVWITGAPEVLLITALDRYKNDWKTWEKAPLQKRLNRLTPDYSQLLAAHREIHSELFNRVEFSLGAEEKKRKASSEEMIAEEMSGRDGISRALLERLFYQSRYLFLSSSGDRYAPRLTGLFIGKWGASWADDYTMDANANMAVLGGHIANLSECMTGYESVVLRSLPSWKEGAEKLYGMRGILGPVRLDGEIGVPHHMTHYHAHWTATGLGPWILYPFWERYETTGDQTFLKETLYPLLISQLHFYEDFLTLKDDNQNLIFIPSNSPENSPMRERPNSSAAINSTMDISACRQLLTWIIKAERDLGLRRGTPAAERLLAQLPPYLVNAEGALQEWSWPGLGENYRHRHASHMYVVWPGYDIHPDHPQTSHLVPAVVTALEKRDHSIVQAHDFIQRAIAWLRVKKAEPFYQILKETLEGNFLFSSLATSHNINHHLYNYDYILSLQGMLIEMAVFTRPGEIELLPAMPAAFSSGAFTGLQGRNQCSIDRLEWNLKAGSCELTLTSRIDQKIRLVLRRGIQDIQSEIPMTSLPGDQAYELQLPAGKTTTLNLQFQPRRGEKKP